MIELLKISNIKRAGKTSGCCLIWDRGQVELSYEVGHFGNFAQSGMKKRLSSISTVTRALPRIGTRGSCGRLGGGDRRNGNGDGSELLCGSDRHRGRGRGGRGRLEEGLRLEDRRGGSDVC
jgi:hypothetical protein